MSDFKIDEYRGRLLEIMKNSNPDMSNEELDEAYKAYKYSQLYDEKERALVNLVETRGVAYFQYTDVINEIVDYVKMKVTTRPRVFIPSITSDLFLKNRKAIKVPHEKTTITVPYEITSKINFFEFLSITVNIDRLISDIDINEVDDCATFGGTSSHYNDNEYISLNADNKLEGENININAYMYNETLIENRIRETLYHEINHAYQNYCILYNSQVERFKSPGNDKRVVTMLQSGDISRYSIGFLLYRLWDKAEMNAAVESVYGKLSKRDEFGYELQSLKAYQEYKTFKDSYIPSIIYARKDVLDEVAEILGITIKDYEKFRKWFMTRTIALNNTFLHKIIKAAGLAYEKDENNRRT